MTTSDRSDPAAVVINELGQPVGQPVPGWTRRPRPGGTVLAGRDVRLEPLQARHAAELAAATTDPQHARVWTYLPIGPFPDPLAATAALTRLGDDPDLVTYAIVGVRTGRTVGTASYLRIDPNAGSLEVGWILYAPELSRTRGATEAMWLMARQAFEEFGYRRYEWKCDALNARSRAAAVRLGFRYEGTFRQALVVKGRNRDTAWYAMTEGDWAALAPAYDRWLTLGQERSGSLSELTRQALAAR